MSDLNLLRYYSRLAELGVEQEFKIPLNEVSERFITSPRHARTLLGQMQELGWLTWLPKAGRNQRSTLLLNLRVENLKERLAGKRVRLGQYEKALSILDNDEIKFRQLLHTTSGASIREGRLHIQLTYKRQFERLVPHHLQRNSERFLIRQLYSCLVSCDPKGNIKPELAHHWEYDQALLCWTFYLRPSLAFHNEQPIDANTVVSLFARLTQREEYQAELHHVVDVRATQPYCVVFQLSEPDLGFAGLIAGVKYSIQPPTQVDREVGNIVGSGPFEMVEHNESKITLKAFERFYGCRALTDQVTIWHIDEKQPSNKRVKRSLDHSSQPVSCDHYVSPSELDLASELEQSSSSQLRSNLAAVNDVENRETRVEDGCLYFLFNQHSPNAMSLEQKRYLSSLFSAENLWEELQRSSQVFSAELAKNLFLEWKPICRPSAKEVSLPSKITIAVYQHSALECCASAMKTMLAERGVQVEIHLYSYRDLVARAIAKKLTEELVLTNIDLDDNYHSSAYVGLLNNPVLHYCLGEESSQWFLDQLRTLKSNTPLALYLEQLEPLVTSLISEYSLVPMFHHRQTLRFKGVLKNVALTSWGWPAIRDVWSVD